MTCKNLKKKKKLKRLGFYVCLSAKKNGLIIFLKSFVVSDSISKKTRRTLKSVGTNPGVIYGLCKVYKHIVYNCPSCWSILSAINTHT